MESSRVTFSSILGKAFFSPSEEQILDIFVQLVDRRGGEQSLRQGWPCIYKRPQHFLFCRHTQPLASAL